VHRDPAPDWVHARRRVIGERLREHRRAAGLSQIQLGGLIGRDHKTVHRWETAATAPTLDDLLLLADALGTPLPVLLR
jgi:transcriptional regulator with XRE-family HTH domain